MTSLEDRLWSTRPDVLLHCAGHKRLTILVNRECPLVIAVSGPYVARPDQSAPRFAPSFR
jgi:hypothetical protein